MTAGTLLASATVALLIALARRADRTLPAAKRLPMNFGPDLSPGWTAPRAIALAVIPGLAALVLLPTSLVPGAEIGLVVAALSFIAAHVFYMWLIRRALG